MHHCLAILEITRRIIDFVEKKSDLIELGRTCKLLFEPSMAVVWEGPVDFSRLVMCMPSDLWSIHNILNNQLEWDNVMFLERDIVLTDFDRFTIYAQFVRTLLVTPNPKQCFTQVSPQVFTQLDIFACIRVLFPSLRNLTYEEDIIHLSAFIGPNLKGLNITPTFKSIYMHQPIKAFFEELGAILPSIHLISSAFDTLAVKLVPTEELTALIRIIPRFDRIHHLFIGPFGEYPPFQVQAVFQGLSQLPALESMTLDMRCPLGLVEVPPGYTGEMSFPRLKRVATTGVPFLLKLFQFSRRSDIRMKHIRFAWIYEDVTMSEIEDSIDSIHDHCDHESLQHIEMVLRDIFYDPNFEYVALSILPPLLAFRNLQVVRLELTTLPLAIDNQMLIDISRSWPNLKSLVLWSHVLYPPTVTFLGLLPLAHCPNLVDLALSNLDMSSLPPPSHRSTVLDHCCTSVHTFMLPNIAVQDAHPLALFISDFFPRAAHILTAKHCLHPVSALVRVLRLAREQERARLNYEL